MLRAMGSAAHAATAVPEPPQAEATLAKAVDDSTPSDSAPATPPRHAAHPGVVPSARRLQRLLQPTLA